MTASLCGRTRPEAVTLDLRVAFNLIVLGSQLRHIVSAMGEGSVGGGKAGHQHQVCDVQSLAGIFCARAYDNEANSNQAFFMGVDNIAIDDTAAFYQCPIEDCARVPPVPVAHLRCIDTPETNAGLARFDRDWCSYRRVAWQSFLDQKRIAVQSNDLSRYKPDLCTVGRQRLRSKRLRSEERPGNYSQNQLSREHAAQSVGLQAVCLVERAA